MTTYDPDQARRHFRAIYGDQCGYVEVATIEGDPDDPDHQFRREWFYRRPETDDQLIARCIDLDQTFGNLYTSTMLYAQPQRAVRHILPSRAIFTDDATEADDAYTYSVQTSPGSKQSYLILDRLLDWKENKAIRRATQADKTGKADFKVARVPGISTNTKAKYGEPYRAHSRRGSRRLYTVDELHERYPVTEDAAGDTSIGFDWPEDAIGFWHGNLDQLLTAEGLPRRAVRKDTQLYLALTRQIDVLVQKQPLLAHDLLSGGDTNESMWRAIVAQGLIFCRYPFEEFAALCWRYFAEHARRRNRGTHWLREEIARLWRYCRPHKDGPQPTTIAKPQPAAPLPTMEAVTMGRPIKMDATGYLTWLKTNQDGDGVVMASQGEIAHRLGRGVATVRRWERTLQDQEAIERRTFNHRHDSYVTIAGAIKTPETVYTAAPDVVLSQAPSDRATTPENEAAPVPIETRRPITDHLSLARVDVPQPTTLDKAIRAAIEAIEQPVVDLATGEYSRWRATPDRVRAWITATWPSLDTTDVESVYPQVRKAMQAERQQERQRAYWAAERAQVRGLEDGPLLVALGGWISKLDRAERRQPGSPYARKCAAHFAIHDDERRRRGLAVGDAPPPARDRVSRKAATDRTVKIAQALNRRSKRTKPAQLGFAGVAEDVAWLPALAIDQGTDAGGVSLSPAPAPVVPQTIDTLTSAATSESAPIAAGLAERLRQNKAQRLATGATS